jgi:hypothetical protein
MEPTVREPVGLESGMGSIYKQQCALRDKMLALPLPADLSRPERHLAESSNLCAEGMAFQPTVEGAGGALEVLEKHRRTNPDKVRLQILEAMYRNLKFALGDPLAFCTVGEIDPGGPDQFKERLQEKSDKMAAFGCFLEALSIGGGDRAANALEMVYTTHTLEAQACLLLAYFSNHGTKAIALEYLTKWFIDCDLKADCAVLEAYISFGLPKSQGRTRINYLDNSGPALNRLKNSGAGTIRELVEKANRRRAEVERIQSDRRAAGICVLCGKPLGSFQKLFGVKKHSGCTAFVR